MMADNLKKTRDFLLRRIRGKRWRGYILWFSNHLTRIVGLVTIVSAVATFVATGFDFFAVTTPKLFAATSRTLLLAGTLRPLLLGYVMHNDLKYVDQCVARNLVVDLDNDGWASDLIVTIYPKQQVGEALACSGEFEEVSAIHLILKEVPWTGWRPRYSLLHAFSMGIPTSFHTIGPFVVASTAARINPGYHIFAYSNGALQSFGSFRSMADEEPKLQLGRHLFMRTFNEFMHFELLLSGEPHAEVMTGFDIVRRNNTAIIVEDQRRWSDEAKAAVGRSRAPTSWVDFGDYSPALISDPGCSDYPVYQNGRPLEFKKSASDKAFCAVELEVDPLNQIASNLACSFKGFVQSPQFPWGWLVDRNAPEHIVRCPDDDDDQEKADYEIKIVVRQ
jgi:hypothetical protein